MATVVDYGTLDPEKGIYGLYDDFFVRITRTGALVFKLKYRIRVSLPNVVGFDPIVLPDIEPNSSDQSIVNPVQVLQDSYFKQQTSGSEFLYDVHNPEEIDSLAKGYNLVRIEVGETFATAADLPPVFAGYDNSDDFWFYNGYEFVLRDGLDNSYSNYRESTWYNTTPVKLPLVNLNRRVLRDSLTEDYNKIAVFNKIERSDDLYLLKNVVSTSYDLSGTPGTPNVLDISGDLSVDGYWQYSLQTGLNSSESKVEYYFQYVDDSTGVILIDTEIITLLPDSCTKYDRYRLAWYNRYGNGFEYLNFWGKTDIFESYNRGKSILKSGVDSSASAFSLIKPSSEPQIESFGATTKLSYVLRTSWINQGEIESLRDLYKSKNVIMYDPDNNIIPVRITGTGYQLKDVRDDLVKVEVTLEVANLFKTQIQ